MWWHNVGGEQRMGISIYKWSRSYWLSRWSYWLSQVKQNSECPDLALKFLRCLTFTELFLPGKASYKNTMNFQMLPPSVHCRKKFETGSQIFIWRQWNSMEVDVCSAIIATVILILFKFYNSLNRFTYIVLISPLVGFVNKKEH